MTAIGRAIMKQLVTLLVLVLLLAGGAYYFRETLKERFFGGSLEAKYELVIKRFARESQLIVAGAEVDTTATQVFTNDNFKDWPEWTQPLTKALVGRDLVVDIPVETEFKLQLEGLTKGDVAIEGNTLTFKTPLVVHVDSQPVGVPEIKHSGSGLVDKAVDFLTSGQKAQEFLAEKSQEALYKTSEEVLTDQNRQEKVAEFASQSLEDLLNLASDEKLEVELTVTDLEFVIVDQPQ